ncbi:MAG: ribonuclease H-like domain-containing protein [Fimbriimonadaceae bacterium]|nr:ribonuclease H-like domain-containing protein [Fimbriimonadaceae bacterium]
MDELRDLRRKLRQRLHPTPPAGFLPPAPGAAEPADQPPSMFDLPAPVMPAGDPATQPAAPVSDSFLPPAPAAARQQQAADAFLPAAAAAPVTAASSRDWPAAWQAQVVSTSWGDCLRLQPPPDAYGPDPATLATAVTARSSTAPVVALDLETCGLRDAPLFLIGLAQVTTTSVELELWLARQLAEEPAALAAALPRLRAARQLLTFNGLTFDWPFLRQRAQHFRTKLPRPPHVDVLPACRQTWGQGRRGCRLVELECRILDRRRPGDDVPGAEIPATYEQFVASGDVNLLRPVLEHNARDLLTTLELFSRLPA